MRWARSVFLLLLLAHVPAPAQPPPWTPTPGPARLELGPARLDLPRGWLYFGPEEAAGLLDAGGHTAEGTELGCLVPSAEDRQYLVVMRYRQGRREGGPVDADELLLRLMERSQAENRRRRVRRLPEEVLSGWEEEPAWDPQTRRYTWAVRVQVGEEEAVHRSLRLLGEAGVLELDLLARPRAGPGAGDALEEIADALTLVPAEEAPEATPPPLISLPPTPDEEKTGGGGTAALWGVAGAAAAAAAWLLRRRAKGR